MISFDDLTRDIERDQLMKRLTMIGMSIIGGAYLILAIFNDR